LQPPRSEAELVARAEALAGRTLGELAAGLGRPVPEDQRRAKGWVGQLVEDLLGATAGSRAEPDFPHLGVELKTLPVDARGRPRESTFVCVIAPLRIGELAFAESLVQRKLSCVLWVPVEAEPAVPLAGRRLGAPLLWRPSPEELAALRQDWELLSGRIGSGGIDDVTAHLGEVLQVRPKAAHARARRSALDEEGTPYAALPRGFYLRATFTAAILARAFRLPSRTD
jgi:DNA mismatch repair protein MutH